MRERKNKPDPDELESSRPSGRVGYNDRGQPVWEWETQTGKFSTDVTTQRLRKLEAPDLSIEETGKFTKVNLGLKKQPGGGANPYDREYEDKRNKPAAKTLASRVADARRAAMPPVEKPSRWAFLKKIFGRS